MSFNRIISSLLVAGCSLLVFGCGFHLREPATVRPIFLTEIQLDVRVPPQSRSPVSVAVRQALADAGVKVTESPTAYRLIVDGETLANRILAVSPVDARVTDYLLNYHLSFHVEDSKGLIRLPRQTIFLQRDLRFDATNVLAKEHEQRALARAMREDAAQQLVTRLSALQAGQDATSGEAASPETGKTEPDKTNANTAPATE